jgi:hypothetical protein
MKWRLIMKKLFALLLVLILSSNLISARDASHKPTVPPKTAQKAAQSAAPVAKPRIPLPPAKPGCYHHEPNGWKEIPCATDAERSQYPYLNHSLSILSTEKPSGPDKDHTLPVVYGEVKIFFDSVGSIKDDHYGPNAFSLQSNTNFFEGNNGHQDWVQFTDQSFPGKKDLLCIWNIDTTTQNYSRTCPQPVQTVRAGGFVSGDKPIIQAFSSPGLLTALFFLPWTQDGDSHPYAAVAVDEYGLYGNWNEVSGWVLGYGDGSHLILSSAEVWTRIAASSCLGDTSADDNPKILCPGQPEFKSSAIVRNAGATAEGNNLFPVIGAPPANVPPLNWPNTDLVWMDFVSTTSGRCPAGTSGNLCTANNPGGSGGGGSKGGATTGGGGPIATCFAGEEPPCNTGTRTNRNQ